MTYASSADGFLLLAEEILGGRSAGRLHPAQAACWLTRRALECLVDDLLRARGLDPGTSSMRSRLTVLRVAYRDRLSLTADLASAWDQLSEACHHHAYQLDPTVTEAQHLLDRVRAGLVFRADESPWRKSSFV